jgi:hypothetical protein
LPSVLLSSSTPSRTAFTQSVLHPLCRAADRELQAWAKEHKLIGQVRDHTGVVISPHKEENPAEKDQSPDRPVTDDEFAASEARIARAVLDAALAARKPPFKDPSVIEYESYSNFPSFCQIAPPQAR